jgi:2-polyprenyl-3-methyl-5-hydroxy-6-metoxy-1,4-benzoquinol methylase
VIRSVPRPRCYLCDRPGTLLYEGLNDRLFQAQGKWNIKRCINAECGLLWLDPFPVDSDLGEAYESYYSHENAPKHAGSRANITSRLRWFVKFGYFASDDHRPPQMGLLLNWLKRTASLVFPPLVAYLSLESKGTLLDVGCGDGDLVRAMQDYGWQAVGVDPDPAAVQFACRRGLEVRLGSLADQGYRSGSFDAVILNHVIEHVPDPILMLKECHRILKPGGRLILATPNVHGWFHRKFRRNWVHLDPPRHLYLFGIGTLTESVRRSGFSKSVKCFTELGAPFAYGASELIRRNGKFVVRARAPIGTNLKAGLMNLAELVCLRAGRHVGEELRLIAEK